MTNLLVCQTASTSSGYKVDLKYWTEFNSTKAMETGNLNSVQLLNQNYKTAHRRIHLWKWPENSGLSKVNKIFSEQLICRRGWGGPFNKAKQFANKYVFLRKIGKIWNCVLALITTYRVYSKNFWLLSNQICSFDSNNTSTTATFLTHVFSSFSMRIVSYISV